jgi:hypothetical protein
LGLKFLAIRRRLVAGGAQPGQARCCIPSTRLFIAVPLLLAAHAAHAQIGFTAGSVYHDWMGFDRLAPTVGADVNTRHFTNTVWWSSAAKSYVGNGWALWEQGAAYWNRGAFGVGPALLLRHTDNSQFGKTSVYPSVAAAWRAPVWSIEGFVHFRDQWTYNHGRGASVMLRRELMPPSSRLGFALRAGVTVLRFSDGLPEAYGTVVQGGIVVSRQRPH